MKKLIIISLCCIMLLCTSCSALQDLNMISDKLLVSVLYTLENNDIDGFTSLFLPSYLQSSRAEIEKSFDSMKEYYRGKANEYAIQYSIDASTRGEIKAIQKTQMSSYEPLNSSKASINQMYYVKTDQDVYLISISWIQDENKNYGITGIRILQYGLEISKSEDMK